MHHMYSIRHIQQIEQIRDIPVPYIPGRPIWPRVQGPFDVHIRTYAGITFATREYFHQQ